MIDGSSTSDEIVGAFGVGASGTDRAWLGEGVGLRNGLYVDLGSNVDIFTVYYSLLPES